MHQLTPCPFHVFPLVVSQRLVRAIFYVYSDYLVYRSPIDDLTARSAHFLGRSRLLLNGTWRNVIQFHRAEGGGGGGGTCFRESGMGNTLQAKI